MVTNINWDDNFAIKWDNINCIYGLVTFPLMISPRAAKDLIRKQRDRRTGAQIVSPASRQGGSRRPILRIEKQHENENDMDGAMLV